MSVKPAFLPSYYAYFPLSRPRETVEVEASNQLIYDNGAGYNTASPYHHRDRSTAAAQTSVGGHTFKLI